MNKRIKEIKDKYPDATLLCRVGSSYECYDDDAKKVSDALGIEVVDNVCSFPYVELDTNLPKLIKAGLRVAITDDMNKTNDKAAVSKKLTSGNIEVMNIPLEEISVSVNNPRKTFLQEDLDELAASIKSQGLLQPITVRPKDSGYEVVCGERRYRACVINKSSTIPCIVRKMTDEEAFDAMICENLNRKDVEPIEEAFAFAQLKKRGDTAEDIALRFGKSIRFVNDRIHLNDLIPQLMLKVKDGIIPISGAMMLCKLDVDKQNDYYQSIKDRDGKVAKYEVERYIENTFRTIKGSVWVKAGMRDFSAHCGRKCDECKFNTKNATCLFYEMNADDDDAQCTNKKDFEGKTEQFIISEILSHSDELMKPGEAFPIGKCVVVGNAWADKCKDSFYRILQAIKTHGYEVIEKYTDVFDGYSSYGENDDRLNEKLAGREVYKVLEVESLWNGIEVRTEYRKFRTFGGEQNSEDMKAQTSANELLATKKSNDRKCEEAIHTKLRDVAKEISADDLTDLPLSDIEKSLLMIAILEATDIQLRNSISGDMSADLVSFCIENKSKFNAVARAFLADRAASTNAIYSKSVGYVQTEFIKVMNAGKYGEIVDGIRAKYEKKNAAIDEKLKEIGYNGNGEKIGE